MGRTNSACRQSICSSCQPARRRQFLAAVSALSGAGANCAYTDPAHRVRFAEAADLLDRRGHICVSMHPIP